MRVNRSLLDGEDILSFVVKIEGGLRGVINVPESANLAFPIFGESPKEPKPRAGPKRRKS
jgi:hypothetical protein